MRGTRLAVLGALVLSVVGAGALGISPVLAGKLGNQLNRHIGGLEAGAYVGFLGHHHPSRVDRDADIARRARCANPGYQATHRAACPALRGRVLVAAKAQAARCARVAFRKAHPTTCPTPAQLKVNARLRSFAQQPASVTGRWTGRIQVDSLAINAVMLPTGKVLWFAYPYNPNLAPIDNSPGNADAAREADNYAEAYVFDPATNQSVRRDPPTDPRTNKPYNIWCAGQTYLRDGRIVVAGGNLTYWKSDAEQFKGLNMVLTFNPFNETWTKQPSMAHGRWYPTLTLLPDGRVVIVAGLNETGGLGGAERNNSDVEVFTPSADLNGVGTLEKKSSASRYFGLYPHLFLVPGGKLLVAGPDVADTALLDTQSWTWQDVTDLPARREWGAATLLPSGPGGATTLMLDGGSDTNIDYNNAPATKTTLVANIPYLLAHPTASDVWKPAAANFSGRSHVNTTILPDGSLFTNGGGLGSSDGSLFAGPVFTGELYSPASNSWTETDPQVDARTYHSTSLLLPDGRVMSSGDDRTEHQDPSGRTAEFYSPPYLYKGARPTISSAPAGVPYGTAFGVGTPDAASVSSAVIIKLGARTHALDVDQRSLSLAIAPAAGGLTLTSPTDPTAAPPGYYMLFLLNNAGVPSVAKMIRLDSGITPPSDTTPPTVALSAPAAGATLTGTTTVSATAADNVGVSGVQFTLDGVNLGTEDTSSPYQASWDTRTATNGAHTLRAVARDAAGNVTTSASVAVTVSNTVTPPPPVTGLVAAYGFEEASGTAVTDSSTAGNPGAIGGGAVRSASGKFGRAIDFDGVNDIVSVPDSNSLDLTTGMTLEAWVNPDTVSSWRTAILKERPGEISYSLYANTSSARVQAEILTGADISTNAAPQLQTGVWTHIAATYDGTALRLFRNGVQVASTATSGSMQTSALPLRIGGNQIWGEYFDGRIDEVRVYNRALTAAQIQSDMAVAVGGG